MFAEAIDSILSDLCTPAVIRAIESGASDASLWHAIEQGGFLELLTDEQDGGAGLSLPELFPILVLLGRHATPLPMAQTIAARALLRGHATAPAGRITIAPAVRRGADGSFACPWVPFGASADWVLADDRGTLLLLSCTNAQRAPTGVYGSLAATLRFAPSDVAVRIPEQGVALPRTGAALYAALLSGAMGHVFQLTLNYCNERVQFGKPIGKFQAVQHQLGVMAQQVASASIAAQAAWQTTERLPTLFASAVAKARASEAAALVSATGHALHGAIGVTEEYDLQLYTRRLHAWRMAYGSEAYWHEVVGRNVLAAQGRSLADFVIAAEISISPGE